MRLTEYIPLQGLPSLTKKKMSSFSESRNKFFTHTFFYVMNNLVNSSKSLLGFQSAPKRISKIAHRLRSKQGRLK